MPHNLTERFSGIVLNQNQQSTAGFGASSGGVFVQEFFLPADYRRGTEIGELRYPELSGFQLFVHVLDGCSQQASVEYVVEYQVFGLGWVPVASGVAIGTPADGDVWITAAFEEAVEIDSIKASARWHITFQARTATGAKSVPVPYANGEANVMGLRVVADIEHDHPFPFSFNGTPAFLTYDEGENTAYFSIQQGLATFFFTTPNPLALPNNAAAYVNGSVYPDICFNFRLLGLVGDEGVDFLGNEYRSAISINKPDAINTGEGSDPDQYWLSKPNPSKFAVENLYFDVRKPGSTTYGRQNLVFNPSFEFDLSGWLDKATGGLPGNITQSTVWASSGIRSARYKVTTGAGTTTPGFGIGVVAAPNKQYTIRADVKASVLPTGDGKINMKVDWIGNSGIISTTPIVFQTGVGESTLTITATSPVGTLSALLSIYSTSTAATPIDIYVDAVGFETGTSSEYFDGDYEGYVWSDTPGNSFSFELVPPSVDDVSTVVDRVLVDPVTPGAYFNVYYTEEGDPGVNDDQWDSKLWTRVPQTYRMERKETHVFPEPIKAKYIKIEFSHLQARHYAPGDFQQAIRYKKHPKWVLDYFLARVQTDSAFLAQRVTVIYDALDLAYNYYLDDLGQEPESTIDVNNTALTTVTSFLSDRSDTSDKIDPVTLDLININMEPYRTHPALRGSVDTLLGEYAQQTVDPSIDYSIEAARISPITTPDVSSLNRDRVVIEQNYPVMFFFVTCRHGYREIEAKFTHDRAYFVGVRQIAFLRDNYMTAFDTATYIEPNADTLNVERNEFIDDPA